MMKDRRVVITGLGVITPVGNDLDTFWSNLQNGVSGIELVQAFDTTKLRLPDRWRSSQLRPKRLFQESEGRPAHRPFFATGHGGGENGDGRLRRRHGKSGPDRFGVIVSSGIGGLKTLEDQHGILLAKGPSRVSPFTIPMLISNMASGLISMEFGLQGPEPLHRHRLRHFEQRHR